MIRALATALAVLPFGALLGQEGSTEEPRPAWEAFDLRSLVASASESGEGWTPFLDRPTLRMGLYRLARGAADAQEPHAEDEVYYVAKGRAVLEVGGERTAAGPGAILFVAAGAPHRFVEVEEDLELVVFFSKAPVAGPAAGK